MKKRTLENKIAFEFIVNKKQLTKHKILNTSILLHKVESSANESLLPYSKLLVEKPLKFELNFMKNAYLNDELVIHNQIQKLNNTTLELCVTVSKKKAHHHDIICKAVYGYTFKRAS